VCLTPASAVNELGITTERTADLKARLAAWAHPRVGVRDEHLVYPDHPTRHSSRTHHAPPLWHDGSRAGACRRKHPAVHGKEARSNLHRVWEAHPPRSGARLNPPIWTDEQGRPSPTYPCPRCGKDVAARFKNFRVENLRHVGCALFRPTSYVNSCGHGQEVVPLPLADGRITFVGRRTNPLSHSRRTRAPSHRSRGPASAV
jgi:hypothetical protein